MLHHQYEENQSRRSYNERFAQISRIAHNPFLRD